LEEKREIMI